MAGIVERLIETSALPALMEFIKIPSVSPLFDREWREKGLMDRALDVMLQWTMSLAIEGLQWEVIRGTEHPPLLYLCIPGSLSTMLLYGHLDKQPAGTGWTQDPYHPTIAQGYLYGRGSADDGYALTSMLVAIKTCQIQGLPIHACHILLENEEESGSTHLIPIVQSLLSRIGNPALVLCLDTGSGDYLHLWNAESIRGLLRFNLTVRVLESAIHSGTGGGVVPSPWTVLAELLDRLEDAETGRIRLEELYSPVSPDQYLRSVGSLVAVQDRLSSFEPLVEVSSDLVQLSLNYINRPTLTITGLDGAPDLGSASSVLLPSLTVVCSFRLPPGVSAPKALRAIEARLLTSPPYKAEISLTKVHMDEGWTMSPLSPALTQACTEAGKRYFGTEPRSGGRGGSIPFVQALQQLFPSASVLLWGAAGPDSSPHGPDERLNLVYYKQVTCSLAYLLQAQW